MTAITISAISPPAGSSAGGETVNITGQYLYTITHITFGGAEASDLGGGSGTSVTCKTPTHAEGIVDVIVTGNSGFTQGTLANGYTYTPTTTTTPTPSMHIESMKTVATTSLAGVIRDFGSVLGGDKLTISVNNPVINASATVTFGGNPATIDSFTTTSVNVIVPKPSSTSSRTVEATVNTALTATPTIVDATSSTPYTYVATPTIETVTPSGGSTTGLNTVRINGTNLLRTPTVNFGIKPATMVDIATDGNSLTCIVPPGTAGPPVDASVTSLLGTVVTKNGCYTYRTSDTTISVAKSTCYITLPTTATPVIADETIVASKTASNNPIAKLTLSLKTADGTDYTLSVSDMVILDISGAGLLSAMNNGPSGKFIIDKATTYYVYADGTPGVGTITVTVNGVNLARKTVTFYGDPATITAALSSTNNFWNNTVTLDVTIKDANGNVVPYASHSALMPVKFTFVDTKYTSTFAYTESSGATTAATYYDMSAKERYTATLVASAAAGTFTIAPFITLTDDITKISSSSPVICYKLVLPVSSIAISLDKTSYTSAEVATLTIRVKDASGNGDAKYLPDNIFTAAGLTSSMIIGWISAATDNTVTRNFTTPMTEGIFIISATTTGSTGLASNIQGTVVQCKATINDSTGSVSNADVLKSIVALIASINKQIQALQKLILKR